MVKYFLNRNVTYKSKKTFSGIYHQGTGWYYPCKSDFWKTLKRYMSGREIDTQKMPPGLTELIENKFLIQKKNPTINDYLDLYPRRVPETVYYQEGSEIDVAVERKGPHGETDFDVLRLDNMQAKIWLLCDGKKTVKTISDELQTSAKEVIDTIKEWAAIENQIARLLSRSIVGVKEYPPQLIYKAPFLPNKKPVTRASADDVHRYHLEAIKDGGAQFDRVESTLSHLYRVPHPILSNQSYGEALYSKIKELHKIEGGSRIVEIGGGMGSISTEILSGLKRDKLAVGYTIYDLSPGLILSQRTLHKKAGVRAEHVNGNGEYLALSDSCIDIALSNEVIADFHTPEVRVDEVKDLLFDHEIPMTEEFFHCYRDAPEKVRVNLGAFQLLKELYRVLKPGGLALVTEYGYQDRLPFRAQHLDHAEYTIQFAQMISVAAALGFNLYLTDAYDLLEFRSDVKLINNFSYQAAYRILENHNISLPNITYTEELFKKEVGEKAEGFKGLRFVEPIKDPIKVVMVLVCTKPEDKPADEHTPQENHSEA